MWLHSYLLVIVFLCLLNCELFVVSWFAWCFCFVECDVVGLDSCWVCLCCVLDLFRYFGLVGNSWCLVCLDLFSMPSNCGLRVGLIDVCVVLVLWPEVWLLNNLFVMFCFGYYLWFITGLFSLGVGVFWIVCILFVWGKMVCL